MSALSLLYVVRGNPGRDTAVDKSKLEKLYKEKQKELESQRDVLGRMYEDRVAQDKPLTDLDILEQNQHCGEISLELSKLKGMLEETED